MFAIALFTVALIILVNLAWWLFYDRAEKLLDAQLSRRLVAIARLTAAGVPAGSLDALRYGDLEQYMATLRVLDQAREADSLSEVFVLDDGYVYLATTDISAETDYFLADLNGPYIDSLFFGFSERALAAPSYRTGVVYLKSAFAPVVDSLGAVVAVVGVEASVDYFDSLADLKHNLYYSSGFSLAGGLLLGLLFLIYQRRVNVAEKRVFVSETHAYLGRMVAVVSHEIKNPLMIIRASAERLLKKHGAQEAEFVVEEVDRLDQIVSGYLDFARDGASSSVLSETERGEVRLAEIGQSLRRHLGDKFSGHEIEWIEGDMPSDLTFEGYPRPLRQVLLNLLINGAEACTGAQAPIALGLSAANSAGQIEIRVVDRGPGMDDKTARRAFEPFFTTRQSGSGLGLYLSRKIVEEMGGKLDIKSEPGKGTEMVLRLPNQSR